MIEQSEYDQKSFLEAWDRIGRTRDGKLIYLHLQKIIEGIPTETGDGALRENHGRRKLAAEIRAAMSEAVRAQDPTIDGRPTVYTFAQPVPVAERGARGARPRTTGEWRTSGPDAPGPANPGG